MRKDLTMSPRKEFYKPINQTLNKLDTIMKKKIERDEMPRHNYDNEIEDNNVEKSYAYYPDTQPQDESQKELFTQGAWVKFYDEDDIIIESELDWKTDAIAGIVGGKGSPENEANTNLICAAPDMYRALKAIIDNWDSHMIGERETLNTSKEFDMKYWSPSASMVNSEFIAQARKALEKANPNK